MDRGVYHEIFGAPTNGFVMVAKCLYCGSLMQTEYHKADVCLMGICNKYDMLWQRVRGACAAGAIGTRGPRQGGEFASRRGEKATRKRMPAIYDFGGVADLHFVVRKGKLR